MVREAKRKDQEFWLLFLRKIGKRWSILSRGVIPFSQDVPECSVKNRIYGAKMEVKTS